MTGIGHRGRPLIAAAGFDVPQPPAGDLALSREALAAVLRATEALPAQVAAGVDGYGIDAFILLAAAVIGPISSVQFDAPKRHAGSFPAPAGHP
ncbi:hypothetical protein ACWDWV_12640 [Streptosporangium sandarakinum]